MIINESCPQFWLIREEGKVSGRRGAWAQSICCTTEASAPSWHHLVYTYACGGRKGLRALRTTNGQPFGEAAGTGFLRQERWINKWNGGRMDGRDIRSRDPPDTWCHEQTLPAAALTVQKKEKLLTGEWARWQQSATTFNMLQRLESYLGSLEVGFNFDLQSAGDSLSNAMEEEDLRIRLYCLLLARPFPYS